MYETASSSVQQREPVGYAPHHPLREFIFRLNTFFLFTTYFAFTQNNGNHAFGTAFQWVRKVIDTLPRFVSGDSNNFTDGVSVFMVGDSN